MPFLNTPINYLKIYPDLFMDYQALINIEDMNFQCDDQIFTIHGHKHN